MCLYHSYLQNTTTLHRPSCPTLALLQVGSGLMVAEVLHKFASVTFTVMLPTPPFRKLNVVAVVLVVAPAELLVMLNV